MLTDEQLVERVRKGKTRALDELYRRYARPLYAFCATMSGAAESEDIVHDVFMRLIESADAFNPQRASFRTWIFRIARNRCIDLIRHQKSLTMVSLEKPLKRDDGSRSSALQETLADHQETVEQTLIKEAGIDAVRNCIDALVQEEERQAIALYYLVGKVYREIGDILGRSTSTAKNYVTSAREKVKRCLEGKGW
jgi:RNA polymerase sigma-70 factor (ECF subfamily)